MAVATFSRPALEQIGSLIEYVLTEPFFAVDLMPAQLWEIVPITLGAYSKDSGSHHPHHHADGALTQMVQVGLV